MKHIIIALCGLSLASCIIFTADYKPFSCKNSCDTKAIEQQIETAILNRPIRRISFKGNTLIIYLTECAHSPHNTVHLYNRNQNNDQCDFLIPCIDFHQSSQTLDQLALDHYLFAHINNTEYRFFSDAVVNGAHINDVDYQYPRMPLRIVDKKETTCTFSELTNNVNNRIPQKIILAKSEKHYLGPNSFGWSIKEHALYNNCIEILQRLKKCNYTALTQQEIKAFDASAKELEQANNNLLLAQKKRTLPTFPVERSPHKYLLPTLNTDNQCATTALTQHVSSNSIQVTLHGSKTDALHVCNMAELYASIILSNIVDGNKLIRTFNEWQHHNHFKELVIASANKELIDNSASLETIFPENMGYFIKKIVLNTNTITNGQTEHFLTSAIRYCAALLALSKQDTNDARISKAKEILSAIGTHAQGYSLMKSVCMNEASFVNQHICPYLQDLLLRNYLMRMLQHRALEGSVNPFTQIPRELIAHIVSFWQPDKRFINGI